jgi:hypothetical protein
MLTILVFEIKKGKNAQKVKTNINRNLSLLIRGGYVPMAAGHVCGGVIPRKFLKFETRKYYFLHSEHPKNKKIINNNLSLLSGVEKRNNLNRFC